MEPLKYILQSFTLTKLFQVAETDTGFSERGVWVVASMDKTSANKMLVDKTPVKIAKEDKMLAIFGPKIYRSDCKIN